MPSRKLKSILELWHKPFRISCVLQQSCCMFSSEAVFGFRFHRSFNEQKAWLSHLTQSHQHLVAVWIPPVENLCSPSTASAAAAIPTASTPACLNPDYRVQLLFPKHSRSGVDHLSQMVASEGQQDKETSRPCLEPAVVNYMSVSVFPFPPQIIFMWMTLPDFLPWTLGARLLLLPTVWTIWQRKVIH